MSLMMQGRNIGRQSGISLVEMVVALMMFSVVALPLIMIPIKAVEQTEVSQNTSMSVYEISEFLNDFQREVNLAANFLPIPLSSNLNQDQQLFVAYWDPKLLKEKRVGYALKELLNGGASYSPRRWQLYRAEIPENADINNFTLSSTLWQPAGKVVGNDDFYMTGDKGEPKFVYCRGNKCDNSVINPAYADGVTVKSQNGSVSGALNIVYHNSKVPIQPLYFRLGSLNAYAAGRGQLMPFSVAVEGYGRAGVELRPYGDIFPPFYDRSSSWLEDIPGSASINGTTVTFRRPIDAHTEKGSGTQLRFRDFHYNPKSGEMWVATNSANSLSTASAAPDASLYLFRLNQKPYLRSYMISMEHANGDSYSENFPVIISRDEPGWPRGNAPCEFIGITQDTERNLYVLARVVFAGTHEFWVQKFSPEGGYLSGFVLGRAASGQPYDIANTADAAVGIAFNPASPEEIMVLLKNSRGEYSIRSYPKDQDVLEPSQVMVSAQSEVFNPGGTNNPAFTPAGFNWPDVRGMDYDPINKRFMFVFGNTRTDAKLLSLDSDLRANPPTAEKTKNPAKRAVMVHALFFPFNSGKAFQYKTLRNPEGVAYNPYTNEVYVSTDESITGYFQSTDPKYYQIVPSARFNVASRS